MPPELPGFYYDQEKNRYFPIKGAKAGVSTLSRKPLSEPCRGRNSCRKAEFRAFNLLSNREMCGNMVPFGMTNYNFKEEYRKKLISKPVIWKYKGTNMIGNGALVHTYVDFLTSQGQGSESFLLAGSLNGCLSVLKVEQHQQGYGSGTKYLPEYVWPLLAERGTESRKMLGHIWQLSGIFFSSKISCIKLFGKKSYPTEDESSSHPLAMITTLGSDASGGCAYVLKLSSALVDEHGLINSNLYEVASFKRTIWTADCNAHCTRAVVGADLGAAIIDLETSRSTWVFRSKSDVLSLQFDKSENIILCGLRNGAILTVDVRQRPRLPFSKLNVHRIPYVSWNSSKPSKHTRSHSSKQWFEIRGNVLPSQTVFMPSSVSCLECLQFRDQYFLASCMDGMIELYDHRYAQRGCVQSYDGNVNSHTNILFGIDPSERFVMSGGEDCRLRIWSVKSGQLLFEDAISNSIISTVCWQNTKHCRPLGGVSNIDEDNKSVWTAWLGSSEGLFQMCWPETSWAP